MNHHQPTTLSIALVLLCLAGVAEGFGAKGHRIIGDIAEQHLSATARTAVDGLLDGQSLAFASTWADEMRSATDNPRFWSYDFAANWHFVNVPVNESYAPDQASALGDAYTAMQAFSAILADKPVPEGPVKDGLAFYFGELGSGNYPLALRRFALRFFVHIVQDLHQPLHVGHASDRGGNQIRVNWFGEPSNLHAVWDTRLVDFQQLGYTELSLKLQKQINNMPPETKATLETAAPMNWIDEGLALRQHVYAVHRYNADFSNDYTLEYVPVVEQQLIRAGLRLAYLLNSLLSH